MQYRFLFLVLLSFLSLKCEEEVVVEEKKFLEFEYLEPIRISYGQDSLQFGELRMPEVHGNAPIIMIIHGGCWLSLYDLTLMDSMALDLAERGFATWNIEYRRTGDIGGGWPGTFTDVANALKHIEEISKDYPVDSDQIYITGHSAGGHLALWLGAQNQLEDLNELKIESVPEIQGIVSLAGITDLSTYYSPSGCGSNAANLIGGLPSELPVRYAQGSPINFLPLGIDQVLINGANDNIVPVDHVTPYFDMAKSNGDSIQLEIIPQSGHFEVITPGSIAWPAITQVFDELIKN